MSKMLLLALAPMMVAGAVGAHGVVAASEPVSNPLQQFDRGRLVSVSIERMECAGCARFIYHEDDSIVIINREPGPSYFPGPPHICSLNEAQIAELLREFSSAVPAPGANEPRYRFEAQFRFHLSDGRDLIVRSPLLELGEDPRVLVAIGEGLPESSRQEADVNEQVVPGDSRNFQSLDRDRMTAIRTSDFAGNPYLLNKSGLAAIRAIVIEAGCG